MPLSFMYGPLSINTQKKKRVVAQRSKNRFAGVSAVQPSHDKEEIAANREKEGSEKTKELFGCLIKVRRSGVSPMACCSFWGHLSATPCRLVDEGALTLSGLVAPLCWCGGLTVSSAACPGGKH